MQALQQMFRSWQKQVSKLSKTSAKLYSSSSRSARTSNGSRLQVFHTRSSSSLLSTLLSLPSAKSTTTLIQQKIRRSTKKLQSFSSIQNLSSTTCSLRTKIQLRRCTLSLMILPTSILLTSQLHVIRFSRSILTSSSVYLKKSLHSLRA